MSVWKATVTALVSAMLLGATAVLAAPLQDGANALFTTQLSEAKQALRDISFPGIGRSERIVASVNLQFAESLFKQGRLTEAQQYLSFARGKLWLFDRSGGRVAPAPMAMQAFPGLLQSHPLIKWGRRFETGAADIKPLCSKTIPPGWLALEHPVAVALPT